MTKRVGLLFRGRAPKRRPPPNAGANSGPTRASPLPLSAVGSPLPGRARIIVNMASAINLWGPGHHGLLDRVILGCIWRNSRLTDLRRGYVEARFDAIDTRFDEMNKRFGAIHSEAETMR
jgi:hypothetical protein